MHPPQQQSLALLLPLGSGIVSAAGWTKGAACNDPATEPRMASVVTRDHHVPARRWACPLFARPTGAREGTTGAPPPPAAHTPPTARQCHRNRHRQLAASSQMTASVTQSADWFTRFPPGRPTQFVLLASSSSSPTREKNQNQLAVLAERLKCSA